MTTPTTDSGSVVSLDYNDVMGRYQQHYEQQIRDLLQRAIIAEVTLAQAQTENMRQREEWAAERARLEALIGDPEQPPVPGEVVIENDPEDKPRPPRNRRAERAAAADTA